MKFLLCGCFHGKVPSKLAKRISKENFDYILCTGDLLDGDIMRKIEFDNWKKLKDEKKTIYDIVPKRKLIKIYINQLKSLDKTLKFLNRLKKPVFFIHGNHDLLIADKKDINKHIKLPKNLKFLEELLEGYKNLHFISSKIIYLKDYIITGHGGYRGFSAKYPRKITNKLKKLNFNWDKSIKLLFNNIKGNKNVIFLTHDSPRGIFDKVSKLYKNNPVAGYKIGDEYYLKYIKKFKPKIHIFTHMHEYQGKKKLWKTLCINPGAGYLNKFALLELENNKIKKIKFYK